MARGVHINCSLISRFLPWVYQTSFKEVEMKYAWILFIDATVYVGGLDEKVSEAILWELFLQAGPVGKWSNFLGLNPACYLIGAQAILSYSGHI
jgi:hypothetical protein